MTQGLLIKQAAALTDIASPDSTHVTLSSYADEIVAKNDTPETLYFEHYRRYTQQTTNNTNTVPTGAYVAVAVGQVVLVKARVVARKSDLAAALGVEMWVVARRASGGNVTLVGSVQGTVQEDSASAPSFTLVADTSNQRVNAQVTGVTSETWNWQVDITGLIY